MSKHKPFRLHDRVLYREKPTTKQWVGTISHVFGDGSFNLNLDRFQFVTYKATKEQLERLPKVAP